MYSREPGRSEEFAHNSCRSQSPARRRAVLLLNLGTPDGPDLPSVRRYLAELLSDPEVIRLPRGLSWLNRPIGLTISRFRAARSVKKYRKIWTEQGSPLRTITEQQVSALAHLLPEGTHVFFAMRYGRPGIGETLKQIQALNVEQLVVVPMYPQYSGTSTGAAVRELNRQIKRAGYRIDVSLRSVWFDDTGYINAQARLIHAFVVAHGLTPEATHLIYSAHSLPASYVERGDRVAFQGNVDHRLLVEGDMDAIDAAVRRCVQAGGGEGHILNLNQGLLKETQLESVRRVVETCRQSLVN